MKNIKILYFSVLLVLVSGRLLAQESETHNTKTLTIKNNNATLRLESVNDSLNYKLELTSNYNASEKFFMKHGIQKTFGNKLVFGGLPYTYLNDYYGLAFMTNTLNPDSTKIRMLINSVGNVGIGTKSPNYLLDAVGNTFHFGTHTNTSTNTQVNISSGVAGSSWVNFGHYNTFDATLWRVGRTGSDQSFRISNWGSGSEVNNLTILQNGNIGIGSTTPLNGIKLDVNGVGRYIADANNVALHIQNGTTTSAQTLYRAVISAANKDWYVGNTAGDFKFYSPQFTGNGGEALILKSTGNVGIGTSNPGNKLEILGDVGNSGLRIKNLVGSTVVNNANGKALSVDTNGDVVLVNSTGGTTSSLIDSTNNNSYWNRSGNFGIGTKTPSTKLDVKGDITVGTNSFLRIYDTGGSNGRLAFNNVGSIDFTTAFMFRNVAGTAEYMRINNTGNVGIGTNAPANMLHIIQPNAGIRGVLVAGGASTNPNMAVTDGAGITKLQQISGGAGLVGTETTTDFSIRTANLERIYVMAAGNVGIGTTNPTEKLDINGNIKLQYGGHLLAAGGFASFGEVYSSSDTYIGNNVKSVPGVGGFVKTNAGIGSMITMQLTDGIRFHTNLAGAIGAGITRDNGEVMRITHYGFVGIGLTNPAEKLDVNGNIRIPFGNHIVSGGYASFGEIYSSGDSYFGNGIKSIPGTAGGLVKMVATPASMITMHQNNGITFNTNITGAAGATISNGANEVMRITQAGNVGIGITAPTNKLEIVGGTNSGLRLTNLKTATPIASNGKALSVDANGDVVLVNSASGTLSDPNITSLANGNVGIGITNPTDKLYVNGSITTNEISFKVKQNFTVNKSDMPTITPISISMPHYGITGVPTASSMDLWLSGYSGVRMFTNGTATPAFNLIGGNLGIGTTTPTNKLEVVGNASLSGNVGIGTTNSIYKLDVSGSARIGPSTVTYSLFDNNGIDIKWNQGNNANDSRLTLLANVNTLATSPGGNIPAVPVGTIGNSNSAGIRLNDNNTGRYAYIGTKDKAIILNGHGDGNVGIGTIDPTAKLEILSPTNTTELKMASASGVNGDVGLTLYRTNYKTEFLRIGAAASGGLFGGQNNVYLFDVVGNSDANNKYFRDIQFRRSSDNGSSYQNTLSMVAATGNIGIGTTTPSQKLEVTGNSKISGKLYVGTDKITTDNTIKLSVGGGVYAEEVTIKLQTAWPDYVFATNYNLKPLAEVEQFVKANNHLPEIPSAKEVEANGGQQLGEMNRLLLQKVEELTLYLIDQNKKLENQQKEIDVLKAKIGK